MRRNIIVGIVALSLGALPVLAFGQSQKADSFAVYGGQPADTYLAQMFRLDISGSITSTNTTHKAVVGESSITAGDWSVAVDVRGFRSVKAVVHEFGSGSVTYKVWNCWPVIGTDTGHQDLNDKGTVTSATVSLPGVEAPGTPGEEDGDPDPLCVDITTAAGVTLNGTTVREFNIGEQELGYLIFEVDACTGDCDSIALLKASKFNR